MRILICVVAAALSGCTAHGKAEVTDKAFENPETRREMLEGTLRVLDDHPEYVDEMFELSLKHPKTFDRLLSDTAARTDTDEDVAQRQAERITAHPRGMQRVMVNAFDLLPKRPKAQQALVNSVEARAPVAAAALVKRPDQLATVFRAIMVELKAQPDTMSKIKTIMKDVI
jgi:hypothetical protein